MIGSLHNFGDIATDSHTQRCFDGARYNGAFPGADDVDSHTVEQDVSIVWLMVGCHQMVELPLQLWNEAALTKLTEILISWKPSKLITAFAKHGTNKWVGLVIIWSSLFLQGSLSGHSQNGEEEDELICTLQSGASHC